MSVWVVDTCVVLDIALNDPHFGVSSAQLLQRCLADGLLIAPITFVELSPAFGGQIAELKKFLLGSCIGWEEPWTLADTETAFEGWSTYVRLKRLRQLQRRPVADVLIGAFASRHRGLITRNAGDFNRFYPTLTILTG